MARPFGISSVQDSSLLVVKFLLSEHSCIQQCFQFFQFLGHRDSLIVARQHGLLRLLLLIRLLLLVRLLLLIRLLIGLLLVRLLIHGPLVGLLIQRLLVTGVDVGIVIFPVKFLIVHHGDDDEINKSQDAGNNPRDEQ